MNVSNYYVRVWFYFSELILPLGRFSSSLLSHSVYLSSQFLLFFLYRYLNNSFVAFDGLCKINKLFADSVSFPGQLYLL